jgi:hypothetical protein
MAGMTIAGALGGAPGASPLMPAAAAESVMLLLLGAMIYLMVRFATLLLPLVVTEDKAVLQTSWALTAGNFWPLLGVAVGTLLPMFLLLAMAIAAVLRRSLDPAAMPSMESVNAAVAANLPLVMGLQFLVAPLLIGLTVAASVFSWRALGKTDLIA